MPPSFFNILGKKIKPKWSHTFQTHVQGPTVINTKIKASILILQTLKEYPFPYSVKFGSVQIIQNKIKTSRVGKKVLRLQLLSP